MMVLVSDHLASTELANCQFLNVLYFSHIALYPTDLTYTSSFASRHLLLPKMACTSSTLETSVWDLWNERTGTYIAVPQWDEFCVRELPVHILKFAYSITVSVNCHLPPAFPDNFFIEFMLRPRSISINSMPSTCIGLYMYSDFLHRLQEIEKWRLGWRKLNGAVPYSLRMANIRTLTRDECADMCVWRH